MRAAGLRKPVTEPSKITLKVQGRLLKVTVHTTSEEMIGGGLRGKVSAFSRASRLRLLQKMHTIKPVGNFHATFITLTYGQEFPSPTVAKRHMDNFLKRLRRRWLYSSGFWRFEFQKRGAPHFHLLLFGLPFVPKDTIAKWWANTIGLQFQDTSSGEPRAPFTRIEAIRSHRKAAAYVSKYVAKCDDSGFNFPAYLTAEGEFIHPQTGEISQSIGRWWGVYNALWLPTDEVVELTLKWGSRDVFNNLKRAVSHFWKGRNNKQKSGWTLFVDNPYRWIDYANYLEQERWLSSTPFHSTYMTVSASSYSTLRNESYSDTRGRMSSSVRDSRK